MSKVLGSIPPAPIEKKEKILKNVMLENITGRKKYHRQENVAMKNPDKLRNGDLNHYLKNSSFIFSV
jgi:hypothetical protein